MLHYCQSMSSDVDSRTTGDTTYQMSMKHGCSVKNSLIDLRLWPFNSKTISLLGYPRSFPIPSLKTLRSFIFELCCWQTDKQTDKLEGTRSQFRTHADDWLLHLANVNEACTKHPQNRRRLVMLPSECRWIVVLVCKVLVWTYWPCDLWHLNPKTVPLLGYPKIIPTPILNTLGPFVSELCWGQTDR